jgi:hypothetical protein
MLKQNKYEKRRYCDAEQDRTEVSPEAVLPRGPEASSDVRQELAFALAKSIQGLTRTGWENRGFNYGFFRPNTLEFH